MRRSMVDIQSPTAEIRRGKQRRRKKEKLAGVPQTNETISAASTPKFTILCGLAEEIFLLNKFFRLSICALVAKI